MASNAADTIEIKVNKVAQLFHTLDPFPFRDRDLDTAAEEFIVNWAREIPSSQPITIMVHLPQSEAMSEQGRNLSEAFNRYFGGRAMSVNNELHDLFRRGRWSLAIGLVVLAVCLTASRMTFDLFGHNEFSLLLTEGLVILGWVANWRPIEIFLYDWWPLVRRRNLYSRLADADVRLSSPDLMSS